MGLAERDVANSVLLSLSGSGQVSPVYWMDPHIGVQYLVNIRVPEHQMDSLSALNSIPINASQPGPGDAQLLANVATVTRTAGATMFSHYNVMPVIDVFGGVSGRDLGGVLRDLQPLIAQAEKELPRGSSIMLRGQAETMHSSFTGLGIGLVMAIVLIYLLLVVNFQSWLDPFIIITALPGALAGVVWALHLTLTTASVPALMGAIMSLGVATANSVLVVTFARNDLRQGMDPLTAAWEAGSQPVAPGADDRRGDGHWHVPDGPGAGRRRRAECPVGPRRDWRTGRSHDCHAILRAGRLQPDAPARHRARQNSVRFLACKRWHNPRRCRRLTLIMNPSGTTEPTLMPPARAARGIHYRGGREPPVPNCATRPSWPPCSLSSAPWPGWFPAGCIAMPCAPRRGNWPSKPSAWCRPRRARPPPD